MWFFKKKNNGDKTKEDRELISENAKAIDALIILAKDNQDFVDKLKELQEKLKYLTASSDSKIFDFDKAIKNKIGDLRILLTKCEGNLSKKETNVLQDIELTIIDRNQKV